MIAGYFGAASFQSLAARGQPQGVKQRCCYRPAAARGAQGPAWFAASMRLPDPRPLGRRSFAHEQHEVVDGFGGSTIGLGAFGAALGGSCDPAGIAVGALPKILAGSDVKQVLVDAIAACGADQVRAAVNSNETLKEYAAPYLDAAIAAAAQKAGASPGATTPSPPRAAWRDRLPADPCATIPADVRAQIPAMQRALVTASRAASCARQNPEEFKRKADAARAGGGGGGGGAIEVAKKLPWVWIGLGAAALGIGGMVLIRKRRARAA